MNTARISPPKITDSLLQIPLTDFKWNIHATQYSLVSAVDHRYQSAGSPQRRINSAKRDTDHTMLYHPSVLQHNMSISNPFLVLVHHLGLIKSA